MRRFAILGLFTLCAASGPVSKAQADAVWSSFGPDDSYNTSVGSTISGATSPSGVYNVAYSFIPNQTVTLDSIDVAMGYVSGTNQQTFVIEAADGPNGGPGVALDLMKANNKAVDLSKGIPSIINVDSTFHPTLVAGTMYWLVAEASGDTQSAFGHNDQGYHGTTYSQLGATCGTPSDQLTGAFRINGTPDSTPPVLGPPSASGGLNAVPEPSAVVSLGCGLVSFLAVGGRRMIRRNTRTA